MISLKSESSSISGMHTAETTPQARPQDSLKFASRYLDGDSNFKIEAINHQTFDQQVIIYYGVFGGTEVSRYIVTSEVS